MSSPLPPIALQPARHMANAAAARGAPQAATPEGDFRSALQDAVRKDAAPARPRAAARAAGGAASDGPDRDDIAADAGAADDAGTIATDQDPAGAARPDAPAEANAAKPADETVEPTPPAEATAATGPADQAVAIAGMATDGMAAALAQPAPPVLHDVPSVSAGGDAPARIDPGGAAMPAAEAAASARTAVRPPDAAAAQQAVQAATVQTATNRPAHTRNDATAPPPAAATRPAGQDSDAAKAALAALPAGLRQMMGGAGDGTGGIHAPVRATPGPSAPIDAATGLPEAEPALPVPDATDARPGVAMPGLPAAAEPDRTKLAAAPPEPQAEAGPTAVTTAASHHTAPAEPLPASPPHALSEAAQAKPAAGAAPAVPVATQILPAVVSMARGGGIGRKVSISITPNEMGEVSITVERGANGTTQIQVGAEKLATLELLRRDHGELVRALNDAGIAQDRSSLSFSWDGGGSFSPGWGGPGDQGGGQQGRPPPAAFARSYAEDTPAAIPAAAAAARGGIDVTA